MSEQNGWDVLLWIKDKVPGGMATTLEVDIAEAAYAAGQAAANNGPSCHKCGKMVEIGDVLCDEHEQEMIKALIAASKAPASGQKG